MVIFSTRRCESLSLLVLLPLALLLSGCPQDSNTGSSPAGLEEPDTGAESAQQEAPDDAGTMGDGMMGDGMMGDGMMGDGMMGDGMMGEMPEWMMSRGGMGPQMMAVMRPIHELLRRHEAIDRTVEDIPGGVVTHTTSDDPEVAELIRTHVYQMKRRVEEGQPIRTMDPVFREIFRHREKIELRVQEIPGGVRVVETSDDPKVVRLIRQHAHRAVSEFVEEGMSRAMQPTPLPEGYSAGSR